MAKAKRGNKLNFLILLILILSVPTAIITGLIWLGKKSYQAEKQKMLRELSQLTEFDEAAEFMNVIDQRVD